VVVVDAIRCDADCVVDAIERRGERHRVGRNVSKAREAGDDEVARVVAEVAVGDGEQASLPVVERDERVFVGVRRIGLEAMSGRVGFGADRERQRDARAGVDEVHRAVGGVIEAVEGGAVEHGSAP
jgi:hypothetical protein